MQLREQIEADIRRWDQITSHRTGTRGDAETADWLAAELTHAGLDPVLHRFPFHRRVLKRCEIMVRNRIAEGVPLFDGGFTGAQVLSAPLAPLGGSPDTIAITQFTPFAGHPSNDHLENARLQARHQAIVAVARGEGVREGLALLNADKWQAPYGPPVLQVATLHRDWLTAEARDGSEGEFVSHTSLEATEASNVQAAIKGTDPDLAPLVIMTPRSGWWHSTSERGGGVATWLTCAREYALDPPLRDIIFTANTGHELGHVGLDAWLAEQHHLIAGAHAWFHLGANFAAHESKVRIQASSQTLLDLMREAMHRHDVSPDTHTEVGDRPYGEARNIHDGNGRFISILGSNPLFHHPDDRLPDSVDMEATVRYVSALLTVTRELARA
ncbi:MAG: hypothetical protein QF921_12900 [Pseudomonadales bacterium]|nr:hypothetical protein [Pseudomonadales bacterium]MDP6470277.1 hypothetical protein [Pseudomonadales bacterium]MDP6827183.1 hypothetical protein [Pseudomonadales bacterium]MDP6972386.1 hypothetical protein [Pseudomonadales bacterium]